MTVIIVAAAVLAWFGCGLLAVYLAARLDGKLEDPGLPAGIALLGPIALMISVADYAAAAGARRHGEGK